MGKNASDFIRDANLGAVADDGDPNQTFNLTKKDTATGDFFYYDADSDSGLDLSTPSSNVGWTFNGSSSGSISIFGGAATITFNQEGGWSFNVTNSGLFDFTSGPVSETVTVDVFGSATDNADPNDQITFNVVCYVEGSQILTVDGYRPIETLATGDRVVTTEGPTPITWIGNRTFTTDELEEHPALKPVCLPKGCFGDAQPFDTLRVSPQHRMVMASPIVSRMFGHSEIMVPAIKLCGHAGIERQSPDQPVTYFHFATSQHQIVFANGIPSESLFFGRETQRILGNQAIEALETIFPEILIGDADDKLARPEIRRQARVTEMLKRHAKNGVSPIDPRFSELARA